MTDQGDPFGDAITAPFWEAAERESLVIQRCGACGRFQFYPRPFCLACDGDHMTWKAVTGIGTVYSVTTVRLAVLEELEPPYQVAVIELDEGPRLLAGIEGIACEIGDIVTLAWRRRKTAPPLPVFTRVESTA